MAKYAKRKQRNPSRRRRRKRRARGPLIKQYHQYHDEKFQRFLCPTGHSVMGTSYNLTIDDPIHMFHTYTGFEDDTSTFAGQFFSADALTAALDDSELPFKIVKNYIDIEIMNNEVTTVHLQVHQYMPRVQDPESLGFYNGTTYSTAQVARGRDVLELHLEAANLTKDRDGAMVDPANLMDLNLLGEDDVTNINNGSLVGQQYLVMSRQSRKKAFDPIKRNFWIKTLKRVTLEPGEKVQVRVHGMYGWTNLGKWMASLSLARTALKNLTKFIVLEFKGQLAAQSGVTQTFDDDHTTGTSTTEAPVTFSEAALDVRVFRNFKIGVVEKQMRNVQFYSNTAFILEDEPVKNVGTEQANEKNAETTEMSNFESKEEG